MEKELLDALPPVVTGIDHELERWNSRRRGYYSGNPTREDPNVDEQLVCPKQDGEPLSTAKEPKEAFVRQRRHVDTSRDTLGCVDESAPNTPRINTDDSQDFAARTPLTSIGLMHLCRRAVILLTRSPTCPNLVERQTGSMNLRLYEHMAPLLARANMSYEDLHTGPQGLDLAGSEIDSPKPARPSFTQRFRTSTDGSGWHPHVRFPRPGERVQVLRNSWSIIVSTCSCGTSATVAPFAGIQDPPYCGVTNLYARDLCYDPRGWWKHAAAFDTKPAHSNDWLYRSSRGCSANGSPCGAMDDGELSRQSCIIRIECMTTISD